MSEGQPHVRVEWVGKKPGEWWVDGARPSGLSAIAFRSPGLFDASILCRDAG